MVGREIKICSIAFHSIANHSSESLFLIVISQDLVVETEFQHTHFTAGILFSHRVEAKQIFSLLPVQN